MPPVESQPDREGAAHREQLLPRTQTTNTPRIKPLWPGRRRGSSSQHRAPARETACVRAAVLRRYLGSFFFFLSFFFLSLSRTSTREGALCSVSLAQLAKPACGSSRRDSQRPSAICCKSVEHLSFSVGRRHVMGLTVCFSRDPWVEMVLHIQVKLAGCGGPGRDQYRRSYGTTGSLMSLACSEIRSS